MATEQQEYTPPPVHTPKVNFLNRIGFGGIFICLVVLVLLGVAGYYWYTGKVADNKTIVKLTQDKKNLRDTTNLLVRLIIKKDADLAGYKDREIQGKQKALELQAGITKAVAEKKQAMAQWSDAQVKLQTLREAFKNGDISAQRLRDSLSAMPVFTDAEANRKYLELVNERNLWRDSTRSVFEQLGQASYEVKKAKDAHAKTLRAVANLRTNVQNRRSAASKGLIKQVVNAGKIKALREIDADLGDIQEESELEQISNGTKKP